MDEERRVSRLPGRRLEDAAFRELVRDLLKDEGYMTRTDVEHDFVPRGEHHQQAVDRRAGVLVYVAIGSLVVGPFLSALAIHLIGR